MKRFSLLLVGILVSLISLYFIARQGRGNDSVQENMVAAKYYEVSGNRIGQVIVKNLVSGEIIRTFQMQEGVVREVFLLDCGKTVSASQKDRTVFWNLETGREIRSLAQRIYSFSYDETKFFTYSPGKGLLYSYPEFKPVCQLENLPLAGPEKFIFSPDDHFLVVLFYSGRPESDEYYPAPNPVRRSILYSKIFNIKTCEEVQEFSQFKVFQLGKFSRDSKFYELKDSEIFSDGHYVKGSWRFDLTTNKIQKFLE